MALNYESLLTVATVCWKCRCRYYSYSYAFNQYKCHLLETKGVPLNVSRTSVSTVSSGKVPLTRALDNFAHVIMESSSLEANQANNFTVQYSLRLGANPLRGAVWIRPEVASYDKESSGARVIIEPAEIALYDNATTEVISVRVAQDANDRVAIKNLVMSCDQAFVALSDDDLSIFISVAAPSKDRLLISVVAGAVVLISIFMGLAYNEKRKQKRHDDLWKVNADELHFGDPLHVVGQGAYLVLYSAMISIC